MEEKMIERFQYKNGDPVEKDGVTMFMMFSAPWCGPCKTMKPAFRKLGEKYKAYAEFHIIDVDEEHNVDLISAFNITSVPTFIAIDGDRYDYAVGGMSLMDLEEFITDFIEP